MRSARFISTIDSHTAGECTRLVLSGLPPIPGGTMEEKLTYATEYLSWLPGFLLLEPRGHRDMFGALLVPPCSPGADVGALFVDNKGFEPMCGHAVIGLVTSLIDIGMLRITGPDCMVSIDTAVGLVRALPQFEDGVVSSVTMHNVSAFVAELDVALEVPTIGTLVIDVAFGGNYFALVDARQMDLTLSPARASRLIDLGMRILAAANEHIVVRHPERSHVEHIANLRFHVEPGGAGADSRNAVVLGNGMLDRSPCGTGTCAEMAARHARGLLRVGEPFVSEGILGTRFLGCIVEETWVGYGANALPAVLPQVTGTAHITGFHTLLLDPADPFPAGFDLASFEVGVGDPGTRLSADG